MYELKDQDTTPPPVDPELRRSLASDGLAAVAIIVLTIGLIALILSQIIN